MKKSKKIIMSDNKKKSFFERLTGSMRIAEDDFEDDIAPLVKSKNGKNLPQVKASIKVKSEDPFENAYNNQDEEEDGELPIDVYETDTEIIAQTFVAGVRPDDLEITITRDALTIKGERKSTNTIDDENYFVKELYWGSFSRSVSLPAEVEPEEAEAIEKHGLIIIKIPKIDRAKRSNLKVKSL